MRLHGAGDVVLTETEVIFIFDEYPYALDLRIPYSSITEVEIKGVLVKYLWIRCRSDAEYRFMTWRDMKALQKAHRIIQSSLTY